MPFIPPEQLARAREMDLLTYLRCCEPEELVSAGTCLRFFIELFLLVTHWLSGDKIHSLQHESQNHTPVCSPWTY